MSLQILIPAGIAIILFIIIIRIYPLIHIQFSKIIFGKFSSRYIATCKHYTGQSPYAYCIKDDFINHIAGFYKKSKQQQRFDSSKEIIFLDTGFGANFQTIRKAHNKPFCINSNRLELFDLKVLGYRDTMFTSEVKKYFYFVDNRFFMGQLTFKNPDAEGIQKLVGVIMKKYLDNKKPESDNFIIYGKNHTFLMFEYNGFHVSISYLSRAFEDINKIVDEYWQSSTHKNIGKSTSLELELMDRL